MAATNLHRFSDQDFFLQPDAPQITLSEVNPKNSVHSGQLKLMMSEIFFLNRFWDAEEVPNPTVVYVGAAPGYHIVFLSQLFPQMTFHLYDPRPFRIRPSEQIILHRQLFEAADARRWSGRNDVYLISDIRSSNYQSTKYNPTLPEEQLAELRGKNEQIIISNMQQQDEWYTTMKPRWASFKFRLPHPSPTLKTFNYLYGHVFLQPWGPIAGFETRIFIPSGAPRRDWDLTQQFEQILFHNAVVRDTYKYVNPFTNTDTPIHLPDLTNDYDSTAHAIILYQYLRRMDAQQATYDNVVSLHDAIMQNNFTPTTRLSYLRTLPIKSSAYLMSCNRLAQTPRNLEFIKKPGFTREQVE